MVCPRESGRKELCKTFGGGVDGPDVVGEFVVEVRSLITRRGTVPSGEAFWAARKSSNRWVRSFGFTGSLCCNCLSFFAKSGWDRDEALVGCKKSNQSMPCLLAVLICRYPSLPSHPSVVLRHWRHRVLATKSSSG